MCNTQANADGLKRESERIMENNKRTKLISVLLIVLCLSLCVGATYAYFTDSVTSTGNKIQAGNLKIDLQLLDRITPEWKSIATEPNAVFDYDLWEPGYTDLKVLRVVNNGNLAIQWEARLVSDNTEIDSELAKIIEVYIVTGDGNTAIDQIALPAKAADLATWGTKTGTLDQFINSENAIASGNLVATTDPKASTYIAIALHMPTTAENEYQDKLIADFDIQLVATQYTHESDAFDNQYDKDACLHSAKKVVAGTPATCTTPGLTEGVNCARCDTVIVEQVETPLAEHTESDWIVDAPAGEGVEGSKHTECTDCHMTITTENIPALPISIFTFADNGDGTYTVTGLKEGVDVPENLEIPSTHEGHPVTAIGNSAFYRNETFTSVTIPDSVTTIGDYAFFYCIGLTGTLTIPDSVTTIGDYAFFYCIGLTGTLTIPNSVTTIGHSAFCQCSGLTGALTIPNSVTTIGEMAFEQCEGLTEVTIPDSVTTIGCCAFNFCEGLKSVTIPNSITTIDFATFRGCSITEIIIPNSVTTIGEYAFSSCDNLTEITIPDSVTTIEICAFEWCKGLTEITIPNSVTTIGSCAFYYCTGLTSITFDGTIEQWNNITFGSDWNSDVPATEVVCSDGVVKLN